MNHSSIERFMTVLTYTLLYEQNYYKSFERKSTLAPAATRTGTPMRTTMFNPSMMIDAGLDGNRAELARHFDKARHGRFEHQVTELRSGNRCVATNSLFGETAPPSLPAIGARLGMIPVEVFQLELTDIPRRFVHLDKFGVTVQHHGS